MTAPTLQLERTALGVELHLIGDWVLAHARAAAQAWSALPDGVQPARCHAGQIGGLDTSGALLLARALRGRGFEPAALQGLSPAAAALFRLVCERSAQAPLLEHPEFGWQQLLARIGRAVLALLQQARDLLGFVGLTLAGVGLLLRGRRRFRLTSTVFHMEQCGFDAVPIVTLLSFLVGAVVAFLGATVLRDFGAAIFTVELVAYSFLREFGVLLTAILLAGRSGSAFTAQIGSMKSREELDAIGSLGLDPVELLVLPRLFALLLMLPLLTFLAMLAGLLGGGLVGTLALDITPGMFLSRVYEMTELRHFVVGMLKAPVFAFLIAVVGCAEGFKVEGSAESVGAHTTASVVQAIFWVIVFDALFAIFFMQLGI